MRNLLSLPRKVASPLTISVVHHIRGRKRYVRAFSSRLASVAVPLLDQCRIMQLNPEAVESAIFSLTRLAARP